MGKEIGPAAALTFNYQLMKHLNGGKQMRSDWRLPICRGAERLQVNGQKVHSTQKPEALLERVILATTSRRRGARPVLRHRHPGAVARRLGRHWVGIERDARYIAAARQRIAAVPVEPLPEEQPERRRLPRVPFATLVASGAIPPGTRLYLDRAEERVAEVLPDGRLRLGDATGSIHQIGALAAGRLACNGWEHWYVKTPAGLVVLDAFRQEARARGG